MTVTVSNLKKCSLCLLPKTLDQFSLTKSTLHLNKRKPFCIDCELIKRKARVAHLTYHEAIAILNQPCYICEKSSIHIYRQKPFCSKCYTVLQNPNLPKLLNYYTILVRFPLFE